MSLPEDKAETEWQMGCLEAESGDGRGGTKADPGGGEEQEQHPCY